MLNDILLQNEVNSLAVKHTNALKNFAIIFNNEKPKKKFKLLSPLKQADFSLNDVKRFNFKAGAKVWKSCSNLAIRNNGGRPKVELKVVTNIDNHMKSLSEIAANRYLIKLKKNARYRNTTYKAAFNSYPMKKKITFSTFYKKICKRFKKPHRLSDLCDICQNGKVIHVLNLI